MWEGNVQNKRKENIHISSWYVFIIINKYYITMSNWSLVYTTHKVTGDKNYLFLTFPLEMQNFDMIGEICFP